MLIIKINFKQCRKFNIIIHDHSLKEESLNKTGYLAEIAKHFSAKAFTVNSVSSLASI